MRFTIDAPAKRPLTPNEKRVYDLLRQGLNAREVARKLHMPYGDGFLCNVHDVTCDTVRHLVTSIREKGYTTNENEEEKPMAKYTAAQKAEVIKLYKSGMKTGQIAIKMKGVNPKTMASWITEYRKSTESAIENSKPLADSLEKENEPVQAATCADSGVENLEIVSTPIINEKTEVVKSRAYSNLTISAVYEAITQKRCEIANLTREIDRRYVVIDKIKEAIDRLGNIRAYAEFELDTMLEDYSALCGEVAE